MRSKEIRADGCSSDPDNHPRHYTQKGIECIEAIEASMDTGGFVCFCKGNAIKYLWRMGLKGDLLEDAKKAQWYINRIVKTLEAL